MVAGSVTVTKKVSSNWADDCEEEDEYNKRIQVISLPTAPRASRILSEDSLPQSPPYLAYLSNLPYDIQENDLYDFFANMTITSIRLPKDDGEGGRSRGFGYVEFETRNELIEAVSIPDPSIRNRRVRIDVSNENDQKRNGAGGNWRGRNDDRGGEGGEGGNRRGFSFRDRERDGEAIDNGDWRSSARPKMSSPPPQRRGGFGDNFNKERSDRSDRSDRPDRSYGRSRGGFEDRPNRRGGDDDQPPMERPKLNLAKRTLPIEEIVPADVDLQIEQEPEIPKPKPVPAAAIFGEAKPVDTSAREREIEERIEKQRLAKLKEAEERREKEKLEKEQKELEKDEEEKDLEKTDEKEKEPEKKEEIISWRNKKEDDKSDSERKRTQSPPRRTFSPSRRNDNNMRRNDDRRGGGGGGGGGGGVQRDNRSFRDRENRDRDFKDRNDRPKDGNFRDRDQRDNRTDYNR